MKTALVTGSSRGIGRATALLLAEKGYQVAVNYRHREDAANEVVAAIQQQGGKAFAVQADIADEEQVMAMFNYLDAQGAQLHALVNNVGVLFNSGVRRGLLLSGMGCKPVFARMITGTFLCCREAIKRMGFHHGGQGGAIVNVSSAAARFGAPNEYVDYAASKGAMDTLTKGLSLELAQLGIRVNGVRPGFIHTEIHADGGEPNRGERITPSVPMRRGGQPEEIAQVIFWLLSDAASYLTGTIIDATGGR